MFAKRCFSGGSALLSSSSDYGQDGFANELGALSSRKARLYSVEFICRLKDIVFLNFNAFTLNCPRGCFHLGVYGCLRLLCFLGKLYSVHRTTCCQVLGELTKLDHEISEGSCPSVINGTLQLLLIRAT